MSDFLVKNIILNPLIYAIILGVLAVIYITRSITEKLPKNVLKAEYASAGLTKPRIKNLHAIVNTLELTPVQAAWVDNVVIDEIYSMIDLSMTSRRKSLRLLFIFRALPLFTSLLTALAAQVESIQNAALFMVNMFTVIGSVANEINRLNKHYASWVFARATANDLYSSTIKFVAVEDHASAFNHFVTEIERVQNRHDRTINDLLSADLDTTPQDKDKAKPDRDRETKPVDILSAGAVGAVAGIVIDKAVNEYVPTKIAESPVIDKSNIDPATESSIPENF